MSEQNPSTPPATPETPAKDDRLVWIDLEMTGLDPQRHVIVEIGATVTDADLEPLSEGIDIVIHATEAELAQMDSYVQNMHKSSGLTEEIKASTVSVREAEDAVLELIAAHCDPAHPPLLAGNSISTDRTFIRAYMPRLDAALHYRMIDVSTLKELARRWHPQVYYNQPDKGISHRALPDILESIRELDFYRRAMLLPPGAAQSYGEGVAAHKAAATARYEAALAEAGAKAQPESNDQDEPQAT